MPREQCPSFFTMATKYIGCRWVVTPSQTSYNMVAYMAPGFRLPQFIEYFVACRSLFRSLISTLRADRDARARSLASAITARLIRIQSASSNGMLTRHSIGYTCSTRMPQLLKQLSVFQVLHCFRERVGFGDKSQTGQCSLGCSRGMQVVGGSSIKR